MGFDSSRGGHGDRGGYGGSGGDAFASSGLDGFGASGDGGYGSEAYSSDRFGALGGLAQATGGSCGSRAPQGIQASRGSSEGGGLLTMRLSEAEARKLAQEFRESAGSDGFVSAEEGKRRLVDTGLPEQQLRLIWDLSDLDRDFRLSLREFACAMHLAGQLSRGVPLPVEVRPEQQEALAHDLERLGGARPRRHPNDFDDEAFGKRTLHGEDYSTADTAESRNLRRKNSVREVDRIDEQAHRRGRDPTPRPLGGHRGVDPFGEDVQPSHMSAEDIQVRREGLDQLASVFEVVARLDPNGELKRLCAEVLEERRELEKQLSRRGDLERQHKVASRNLEDLREERRRLETDAAANQQRINHLQDELLVINREVKETEEDVAALRESSDLRGQGVGREGGSRRGGPAPYASPEEERRDVLSKVRAERELLQRDQRSIEELRLKLEQVFKEKQDAQVLQETLLERQRQAEQDRGLMLTAIEAERGKLSQMRVSRIAMWEERCRLEREVTDIAQERWLTEDAPPPHSRRAQTSRGNGIPANSSPNAYARDPQGSTLGEPYSPGENAPFAGKVDDRDRDPFGFGRGAIAGDDSTMRRRNSDRGGTHLENGVDQRRGGGEMDRRGVRNEDFRRGSPTDAAFGGGAGDRVNKGFGGSGFMDQLGSVRSIQSGQTATFG